MRKISVLSVLAIFTIFTWILFTAGAPATAEAADPQKIAFIYVSSVGDLGWSYEHDNGRKMLEAELGDKMNDPTASGWGILVQAENSVKIKQFELLHPSFCLFLIRAMISDVIPDCFL